MNLQLKNVKFSEFASEETNCFEATVYVDGVRAFTVHNDGRGGCDYHYPIGDKGKELLKQAESWAKTQTYTSPYLEGEHESDLDIEIGNLFDQWQEQKWLKKNCNGKTLFRIEGDILDNWRVIAKDLTEDVRQAILNKYGNGVLFANDLIK